LKILLLIGFIIYFGFAMSVKYGTPTFPIVGNVFLGNAGMNLSVTNHLGFALFILVVFTVFVVAWERILRRSLERLIDHISKTNSNNPTWSRIRSILGKYSW
jgi:hypothetical protein